MPYFAAMIRSLTAYNGGGHVVYIATKEVTSADVEENVKIIHYLSANKPWKETYRGILKPWYDRFKVE